MPTFFEILRDNEDWLMQRILDYAKRQGYAALHVDPERGVATVYSRSVGIDWGSRPQ